MISFWAYLEESDLEAFAGTLILPSYMSYLQLVPFRWDHQPSNPDGRQALVFTYIGQGRVEELPISPEEHALALLHYAIPAVPEGALRIPEHNAIWIQTRGATAFEPEHKSVPRLKVFFESEAATLQENLPQMSFSPFQTYVSVSRRELFIGSHILQHYLQQWLRQWLGEIEFQTLDGTRPASWESEALPFVMAPTVNGIGFDTPKLGGELLVENDEVFRDLIRFSGLREPLKEISKMLRIDFDSPETQVGEAGILLKLAKGGI